ncbi:uncharacterized protein A1O9_02953 [Exophiala aquamarina CBS 119918]|uniref:Uncharacterized protein n=1 Tax=Exophiala aquamarina CBS 119918 TaxID=1182545 RepID=A0A072PNS8_9EURO|nr:uncharacterized protein A1O9_02953 [Exophiala aquamarina CBS 119918]KEF61387.1 hypothetical protein A1O9_02953 [Exophiala aquamarina CBS 119918]
MSRHKENNPLSTKQRPSLASMIKNVSSDDFFTDSILENSSIPSPSPTKSNLVKPRRAVGITRALQTVRESNQRSNKPPNPENGNSRSDRHLQPALSISKKKSRSPLRTNGLSTPPRSRSMTTQSEFSSPPAGMTDVYQRIADEEDLVATEREPDSDEEDLENGPQDTIDVDIDTPVIGEQVAEIHAQIRRASRPVNPAQLSEDDMKENHPLDKADIVSDPPTLDYLHNEMTDRVLAAKLTPHVVDRAKDRARLEKLRQSRIPIDFKNSPKLNSKGLNGQTYQRSTIGTLSKGPITFDGRVDVAKDEPKKTPSESSASSSPPKRVTAFSRATRPNVTQTHSSHVSGSDSPTESGTGERVVAFSRATRVQGGELGNSTVPSEVPGLGPRLVAFSRASRPSNHARAHSEEPEQTEDFNGANNDTLTSVLSEPLPGATSQTLKKQAATASFLAKWRQQTAERRSEKSESVASEEASPIDWAAAGADVPLPSVEQNPTPHSTPTQSPFPSIQKQRSIDRIRKWENDFTGLSFQVSDSPPVRNRPNLNDSLREREIENLTKQAVTTNRLGEIQEKDPNVLVRKTSRTFVPEERQPAQSKAEGVEPEVCSEGRAVLDEDLLPNAPLSLHRSSTNSTNKFTSSPKTSLLSQDSLDHLQRLARAASATPRASSVPEKPTTSIVNRPALTNATKTTLPRDDSDNGSSPEPRKKELPRGAAQTVAETPKIIGAWTDTILPDTVKTVRQQENTPYYAETPHVNAGGWIDTPLPTGKLWPSVPIPTTIEEVTEELTNGAVSEKFSEAAGEKHQIISQEVMRGISNGEERLELLKPQGSVVPLSALANVLNEAKQKRLISNGVTEYRDDTLNLGDATIQSFEELLNNAEDITADISGLIKAGAEEEFLRQRQMTSEHEGEANNSEVMFIGHLTSRMERLMSNLHEARKGISRLEQKVAHSPTLDEPQALTHTIPTDPDQPCEICGRTTTSHTHSYPNLNSWLPMTYSIITLPIPLLFYPLRKGERGILRRPTWLGWLTITVWTWYLIECVMCEIYARPLYAEHYVWPAEPEPEFPLVLPTMVFRWTHFDQLAPGLWRILVALYRVIGMILGFTDGFVGDSRPTPSSTTITTEAATQATRAAWNIIQDLLPGAGYGAAPGLSMTNDEYL